ncbi:EpsD family peptidyl-prolyl cis-trans isomerase [Actimicrobium sp. CCI2.3]|uniref:EpsD family peptidyl-prolyl cis-trans isomerase n=1 Tax=Actimicrobium sp. CCI2.3 TaxID=3048616 RepID=UPI002AB365BB|nr:EpsD family peptidyl-prolyl cis-trans isomerase [Actimicrobium sp. CCI2.3]MDY7576645.1 EpsD family peptidyl-prolyl cis-trans isomerase [Actimicrobium sp. CCI2.3]MEB0021246.1 EpsD family peptidyl-prolyl cis-trans isomerase [Actimicrobium sp. CCI2.3]
MNKSNMARSALVLMMVLNLSACGGDKKKEASQSLVRIDGQEITVLQLNEELGRTPPQATPEAQAATRKQVLEALVDRQLLLNEAASSKLDRDPKVMQAIERAKAQILAQAYLQAQVAKMVQPTRAEIDDYFVKHPEFFTQRKSFDMQQLVIATKDFSDPLRTMIDNAKSLDEVAAWLDGKSVQYARNQVARTTADLPPQLVSKLQGMKKGQLFVIKENDRSLLVGLNDIKESPVTAEAAVPQIEQYLRNQKSQETAKAELVRLRSLAKLEYLNKVDGVKDEVAAVAPSAVPVASTATDSASKADNMARGVAGLK